MFHTVKTNVSLQMESLDDRAIPSVTSIGIWNSTVYHTKQIDISMDNNASNVTIARSNGQITVTDSTNGFEQSLPSQGIQAIVAFGGNGNDTVNLDIRDVQLRAYGFGGDDYLLGYDMADVLDGGVGNDTLAGFGGRDKLYGRAGSDVLRGMNGDDYLNGGGGYDSMDGGNGIDTFRRNLFFEGLSLSDDQALPPVPLSGNQGTYLNETATDTTQDSQWDIDQADSPTCSFLAALSAYAERTDLSSDLIQAIRLSEVDDLYGIRIYAAGRWTTQWVNGDWTEGRDPGGRLWVTLYHKAYLQAWGVQSRDADGRLLSGNAWTSTLGTGWRNASNALNAITPGYSHWTSIGNADPARIRNEIYNNVYNGPVKLTTYGMVASTKASGTTNGIVANHSYMMYDAFTVNGAWKIRLYNPWAKDSANGALDSNNDGLITITWAQFKANFTGYTRNSI